MMKVSSTITKRAFEFEIKAGETVANYGSDCRLQESRHQSDQEALSQRREIIQHPESALVVSEIKCRRNPIHHRIDDVGRNLKLFESM